MRPQSRPRVWAWATGIAGCVAVILTAALGAVVDHNTPVRVPPTVAVITLAHAKR